MKHGFYRMSLLSRQRGHANMFSDFLKNAFNQKPKQQDQPGMFQNKPITEGWKISADKSKLELADGYEPDPTDPTKARKKSQSSPLTSFEGLFTMPDSAGEGDQPPAFALDPEKLKTLAGGLNFAGQLTPEVMDKLKSGDATATQDVLNGLGRNVYATLMQHLPQLTEKFVDARVTHSQKGLGKRVKSTLTQQSLEKLAEGNPVLKEQLDGISSKLLSKYPDATPDWISEQTKEYFVQMGRLFGLKSADELGDPTNGQKPDSTDLSQKPDFDWGLYVGGTPSAPKK